MRRLIAPAEALNDDDRSVFVQCGLEGRTTAEAALVVGATAETVKKRWSRLRAKLPGHPIWNEFDPQG